MGFSDWLYSFDSSGWLGAIGLGISLIGFLVTAWGAWRAKAAADAAVAEVQALKAVADLSRAVSELEEVKRLHLNSDWKELPARLTQVRRLLVETRGRSAKRLSADDDELLRASIVSFSELEKLIHRKLAGSKRVNVARIGDSLIDRIDQLLAVIARLS